MTAVDAAPERDEAWQDETPAPAGWRPALALAAVALLVCLALLASAGAPLAAYGLVAAAVVATGAYVAAGVLS